MPRSLRQAFATGHAVLYWAVAQELDRHGEGFRMPALTGSATWHGPAHGNFHLPVAAEFAVLSPPAAHKGLAHAAKIMAATSVDLLKNEGLLRDAKAEHETFRAENEFINPSESISRSTSTWRTRKRSERAASGPRRMARSARL
jgi:hypothetical protein